MSVYGQNNNNNKILLLKLLISNNLTYDVFIVQIYYDIILVIVFLNNKIL